MNELTKLFITVLHTKDLLRKEEGALVYEGYLNGMIKEVKDIKLKDYSEEIQKIYIKHNIATSSVQGISYHLMKLEGKDFKRIKQSAGKNPSGEIHFFKNLEEKKEEPSLSQLLPPVEEKKEEEGFNLDNFIIEELADLAGLTSIELVGKVSDPSFQKMIALAKFSVEAKKYEA